MLNKTMLMLQIIKYKKMKKVLKWKILAINKMDFKKMGINSMEFKKIINNQIHLSTNKRKLYKLIQN